MMQQLQRITMEQTPLVINRIQPGWECTPTPRELIRFQNGRVRRMQLDS